MLTLLLTALAGTAVCASLQFAGPGAELVREPAAGVTMGTSESNTSGEVASATSRRRPLLPRLSGAGAAMPAAAAGCASASDALRDFVRALSEPSASGGPGQHYAFC